MKTNKIFILGIVCVLCIWLGASFAFQMNKASTEYLTYKVQEQFWEIQFLESQKIALEHDCVVEHHKENQNETVVSRVEVLQ